MERIIVDSYIKGDKQLWTASPAVEFNQKIVAVNDMYAWLYAHGILQKVSFEFKDYSDACYFAFDAKALTPYRAAMGRSGVKDAALAVQHIFDEEYTPCFYCGGIQLGWSMSTYRDVDGFVGRSWECELIQGLGTNAIVTIEEILERKGTRAAVEALFKECAFKPSDLDKGLSLDKVIADAGEKSRECCGSEIPHINNPDIIR